ncbi:hypothetical protein [uncultured Polaribacter sp.]|uniref:hypothetical protein n=1 Tax=uncultured Polaribacter sp. TaxID=174711 RepID=UPI00261E587D|nr:hypothetical protein [uncultured Polaribacter sp.]
MKNKVVDLFGNKVVQNAGVKYSELLEQFMAPFSNDFRDMEYLEDIFEFAINAWNFGNMKVLVPQEKIQKPTDLIEDIDIVLLNKMIDYKVSEFREHTNFIVDYELTETSAAPILKVLTQIEEDYLSSMINALENEVSQNDFEENYINRDAIILKPKQPFLDWYNGLYPDDDSSEEVKDPIIYLIDEKNDDVEKWLKKKFDKFFTMVLGDWHLNKKEWPQRRNYKMFNLWFRVETVEMIYDLEKRPVLK